MAIVEDRFENLPMSVRIHEALLAVKKMGLEETVQLFVKAKLMTEAEAQEILSRKAQEQEAKPKSSRGPRARKSGKRTEA